MATPEKMMIKVTSLIEGLSNRFQGVQEGSQRMESKVDGLEEISKRMEAKMDILQESNAHLLAEIKAASVHDPVTTGRSKASRKGGANG